jgi:hypothetical protein
LQGEGLLDFGVGGEEEVEERDEEKEGVEEDVCEIDVSQGSWPSKLVFYDGLNRSLPMSFILVRGCWSVLFKMPLHRRSNL